MKTKPIAIILILLSTFVTASAQFFLKKGADLLTLDIMKLITNYSIIIGCVLYGIGAIILIYALKNGELNVLYPIYSTGFIWVILISYFFLDELITIWQIAGIIFIIGGVSYIGIGSRVRS